MTTPTHLARAEAESRVRAACVAANPALMAQNFGCEAVFRGKGVYDGKHVFLTEKPDGLNMVDVTFPGLYTVSVNIDDLEFLGRDPSLADVLLALGDENILVDCKGNLARHSAGPCVEDTRLENLGVTVDLRAGLSGWSDETVAAIAGLLQKNA
jgi:hypothetical protein